MRLVGKPRIQNLLDDDGARKKWALAWVAELENASWKHPMDVKEQFPNSSELEPNTFQFPVSDCESSVYLQIAFQQGIAVIVGLE